MIDYMWERHRRGRSQERLPDFCAKWLVVPFGDGDRGKSTVF